jgi:hypothetical protein
LQSNYATKQFNATLNSKEKSRGLGRVLMQLTVLSGTHVKLTYSTEDGGFLEQMYQNAGEREHPIRPDDRLHVLLRQKYKSNLDVSSYLLHSTNRIRRTRKALKKWMQVH